MKLPSKEILKRLGNGASISAICHEADISRAAFDAWWKQETRSRVPDPTAVRHAAVGRPVRIQRDQCGIPHIFAEDDNDLFFGFGYAMAQDRLFQLDYFRRRGSGRLAEILGADGRELDLFSRVVGPQTVLELDLLARTVGIRRSAEREWAALAAGPRALVTAFCRGVNALIDQSRSSLPIEFALLDYEPEPWTPVDCLTIEGEFRWYLTGRFPVIVIPEMARRVLGDGPLFRAFLQAEGDEESILPAGAYPRSACGVEVPGDSAGDPQAHLGSNNWVVAGARTTTGKPLLASDPHIAFDAISCWYEVHLCGGSFNVAGAAYAGMPAILFGRNQSVAWGCTNNICSQRDLYQERTDPAHPSCFLYDGRWERAREREEIIQIKGGEAIRKSIRSSRNGPIVDEVLPPFARQTGPVSLKWLGAEHGGWLTALLGMNLARTAHDFREALRPWLVPTFSVVFADKDGHIGYQAAGRIPIRKNWQRGYRSGWDPDHQWQGLIPFEGMPRLADPERGWIAGANNRPAPNDFPYPLSGTWSDGLRARRIRQMIEASPKLSRDGCAAMHQDARNLRAQAYLPALLAVLAAAVDSRVQAAAAHLRAWDCHVEPDRVGATIFEVFFAHWTKAVVCQRFDAETTAFLAGAANGLAAALLAEDRVGWFADGNREPAIIGALQSALTWLTDRLGPDMTEWQWSKLHVLPLRHVLSGRGDLGTLLDHGGVSVKGNMHTVCNTGLGTAFDARSGAGYRMIADLSEPSPGLWAVDAQSESGNPGSPHYADQLSTWLAGQYHLLTLDDDKSSDVKGNTLLLEPRES